MPCELCCSLGPQESASYWVLWFCKRGEKALGSTGATGYPRFAVSRSDSNATCWTVISLVYHTTSRMTALTSDILATKKEIKFPSQKEGFQAQPYPCVGACYNGSHWPAGGKAWNTCHSLVAPVNLRLFTTQPIPWESLVIPTTWSYHEYLLTLSSGDKPTSPALALERSTLWRRAHNGTPSTDRLLETNRGNI